MQAERETEQNAETDRQFRMEAGKQYSRDGTGRNAMHAVSIESQSTRQDELADDGADCNAASV